MTVQHSSLTDPELHEPKGISTAGNKNIYVADGAGSGSWQSHSAFLDPYIHEPKGISTAAAGTVYLANGAGSGVWTTPPSAVFSAVFTSAPQIITAAGSVTVAHGLGAVPFDYTIFLENQVAEYGYSIGDIIKPQHMQDSIAGTGKGCVLTTNAVNIFVRYGDDANTFNVLDKTTGAEQEITNANWRLIIKAWR